MKQQTVVGVAFVGQGSYNHRRRHRIYAGFRGENINSRQR